MNNYDLDIAARTIYGEARGEDYQGKKAVAHVIINRHTKSRQTIAQVCLRPKQFSCWNTNDPNYQQVAHQPYAGTTLMRECLRAFLEAHDEEDFTKGSTHYHATWVSPYWIEGKRPTFAHGGHLFYNDVD